MDVKGAMSNQKTCSTPNKHEIGSWEPRLTCSTINSTWVGCTGFDNCEPTRLRVELSMGIGEGCGTNVGTHVGKRTENVRGATQRANDRKRAMHDAASWQFASDGIL